MEPKVWIKAQVDIAREQVDTAGGDVFNITRDSDFIGIALDIAWADYVERGTDASIREYLDLMEHYLSLI